MRAYRHVALVLIALLGAALIIFPLAAGLPKKTQAVDDLTNDFRSGFTKSAIAENKTDLATMNAMLTQLQAETLPGMAQQARTSTEGLVGLMGMSSPEVPKGLKEVPTIMPRFNKLAGTMDEQAGNFRQADDIPTSDLPNTAVTYLYLIPGIILLVVGAGGLLLSFTGTRAVLTTVCLGIAAVIGLGLVVGTFATGVVGKTEASEKMFTAFRPTFTDAGYQQAHQDLKTLGDMAAGMKAKSIPQMAKIAQKSTEQFTAELSTTYPAVGKGLLETDRILAKFNALVDNIGANIDTFKNADSIPDKDTEVSVMPWLLIGPGLAVLLLSGVALVGGYAGRGRDGSADGASSGEPAPASV
ncbi:hypothetical protein [Streptomyces sp. SID3343]|uniref:hypothetical protein n=1 Tax=Streptomyces sp. SID3343 TaxID=2690260 RepID=UPI00136B3349|nr:hypothetical protein [Streptomyces sp. SID3343]MYW00857.1 hypothetical protein [Streptomyces sp. SID3343]